MNRVTKRTWLMGVFILVLMLGMALFFGEYVLKAQSWVVFPGSPHVYNNANNSANKEWPLYEDKIITYIQY